MQDIMCWCEHVCMEIVNVLVNRTGALLGACTYTSTGKKYALIREMRLIKSAFSMQA